MKDHKTTELQEENKKVCCPKGAIVSAEHNRHINSEHAGTPKIL